jgi:tetratricopeptide (TPR) repeat protein
MRSWVVLLVALLALAGRAAGQDAPDQDAGDRRARQHFQSATAYFETGDYESALREFRASYAQSPRPQLLYNIFLCQERLGELDGAIESLRGYLASDDVENRDVLEQRLRHLEERRTRAEAGPEEPEGPAPSAPAADGGAGPPGWAIASLVVAGVGLIGFGVAGAIVLSEDGSLSACKPSCAAGDVGTIEAAGIIADVSAGVALVAAAVGIIGLLLGAGSDDDASTAASIEWRGLGVGGRF